MEDALLDTPPSSVRQPDVLIRHALGILSLLALLFAGLLILTYGTGAAFRAVRVFFTAFIILAHAVSIARFFVSGAYSEKRIQRSLLLSPDVHYLTLFVLFTLADLTPILTIINYVIALAASGLNYAASDILPLLGQTGSEAIDTAKRFAGHPVVTVMPVYLELALVFQLSIVTVADLRLIHVLIFVVYIGWIVMFNYATSAPHRRVWASIAARSRGLVEANQSSFGPVMARVTRAVARLGPVALQWYK
jgi:hypothetical protein